MRLIKVSRSPNPKKKLRAVFETAEGRTKSVDFGSAGMDDYTRTGDTEQRHRYRTRHKKDLQTGDPTRSGYLSFYILWGDSTSVRQNIADYKKRFDL
jgi:hypothetical protein